MPDIIVFCPWCECPVIIEELNCKIFRHAYYKITFQQIGPHMSKEDIDILQEKDLLVGCGFPFCVNQKGDEYIAEKCGYI